MLGFRWTSRLPLRRSNGSYCSTFPKTRSRCAFLSHCPRRDWILARMSRREMQSSLRSHRQRLYVFCGTTSAVRRRESAGPQGPPLMRLHAAYGYHWRGGRGLAGSEHEVGPFENPDRGRWSNAATTQTDQKWGIRFGCIVHVYPAGKQMVYRRPVSPRPNFAPDFR